LSRFGVKPSLNRNTDDRKQEKRFFRIIFFFHQGLRISVPASFCIEDVTQQKDSIHLLFAVDKLKDKLEAMHHESLFQ